MAVMVLRTCQQVEGGLPAKVTFKMWFNIILDFGMGLCPIIGDVADAVFRANTRNAVVLEKYLRQKGAAALKAQGQAAIDPSDPDEYDMQKQGGGGWFGFGGKSKQANVESGDILQKNRPGF
jgi:Domain of unknown function (DUF4112)